MPHPAVDTVIDATVVEVRDFGLVVETTGCRGIVTVPELSWRRVVDTHAAYAVGDRIRCRVLRAFAADDFGQTFAASIRAADPGGDPWRDPTAYRVGETFTAAVDLVADYGVWLEHPRGGRVLVRNGDLPGPLGVGDHLPVTLTAVLRDEQYLTAVPAEPPPATRPTPR